MKDVFTKLTADFLSAAVFFILYIATDDVVLATATAIAVAVVQVIWARIKGQTLGFMAYASIALVIVLGSVTLLTNDPRFMFAKPAIGHFAIGAIMLKRGWMLRYVPAIVSETIPEYVTVAGYAWAALMFALGLGTIAVAMTGDIKLWAIYMALAAGAKVAAFALQFIAFRLVIASRMRAARA
ncbi:intracellular septation protein [Bradyrhizobium sp. SSBR45G]|uniref:septation protein IspZ n=1 Tax=unclassified Bradyrhizobium TaxID=2631580 RepID=UPI002342AAFE|nr:MULTISPECIES: septation protein IspZ [unclassified Bradyrhizobium]GLH79274.1 intracellular septation protein [Bradyrhizobium sp. SSBR45G]GLH86790.1 intracellular septation protein [Bradyrhizobium sp. SSBR45R]